MAEILGIVAGGIAVGQASTAVGNALLKLKNLCQAVKDLPNSIESLAGEVECLSPMLLEAERQLDQQMPGRLPSSPFSGATRQSIEQCRSAWQALSDLVDGMSHRTQSRTRFNHKLESVKIVLKKDQLRTLETKLKRAVTVLQLALQLNTM
jgi:hypothetical protein